MCLYIQDLKCVYFRILRFSMLHETMDPGSYKSLLSKTQEAISCAVAENLVTSFDMLLTDCRICIKQCLQFVVECYPEPMVSMPKLTEYMNEASSLLKLLSNSIKAIIGTRQITYSEMKTFPIVVVEIIANVFSHCKDSEPLCGSNCSPVKKELKKLFKSCHELQLTYLMVLEKHFVFNLTALGEKKIFLEALAINLRLVETVLPIDAMTMAAQCKTLITMYEKYTDGLADTTVFEDCMIIVCQMIRNTIKIAVETNDEKIINRSLKVANFLLKTLMKICDIFEQTVLKECSNVFRLFFYIHKTRIQAYLQMPDQRTQFINLIVNPSDCVLEKLLCRETFANVLLDCDIQRIKEEGSFPGYVLTITAVMDCLTQERNTNKSVTKCKLITCLFSILTKCNSWNLDVIVWSEHDQKSHSLFEHLLIHTLALALTLNCEEFAHLERCMIEALLGTDHNSALFASNLWESLHMARDINPQLLFNEVIWLCTMYKKLEEQSMFRGSPQKIHLTHTIAKLFCVMEKDDKIRICKQFRIHDDDNLSLWGALGVKSLPQEAKTAAEAVVAEKLKMEFQCFNSSAGPEMIDKLIKVMAVAATCTFSDGRIVEYITWAWSKTCPEHQFPIEHVAGRSGWLHGYIQALVALTETVWHHLSTRNEYLVQILRYIASVIQQCGADLKLLFVNIVCKLATTDICESKLDEFTAAFASLHQTRDVVRHKLFIALKEYSHKNIDRIVSNCDNSLQETWIQIKDKPNCIDLKDMNVNFKYIHKCSGHDDTR